MTDADKKRFAHVMAVWRAYKLEIAGEGPLVFKGASEAATALTLAHFMPYTVTPDEYCPPEADEAS